MQPCYVGNFRARLSKLGYTNIKIKRVKYFDEVVYLVLAVEPLSGSICCRYMTIQDMVVFR